MSAATARAAPVMVRIETANQIPSHIDNICRPGGSLRMRVEDSRLVALLDVGEKRLIALWAGEAADRPVLTAAITRARAEGYQILETREATQEMVALCAENRQQDRVEDELEDTEATRLFDQLLSQAYEVRASDMHLQLYRRHASLLVRVNGELVELRQFTLKAAETLARAMYSQADIDSRMHKAGFNPRTYQDASISRSIAVGGNIVELKLRWASGPVWPDAFDVALRILNISSEPGARTLSSLGYTTVQQAALTAALKQPSGMIMLCGTTGAGKSTTLATLAEMWALRYQGLRMLRTLEDPPEYVIHHARQMPVSRVDKGAQEEGFHQALRAAMRMDPDALLLGEIRDAATADLSQQAVDTGHKVFTTQHAGSVFDALWRIERLGVARERLTSEGFINAIVHQMLVPVLCPHCSTPYRDSSVPAEYRDELESQLAAGVLDNARVRGDGCSECHNGISGRQALASILMPDTHLRDLIRSGKEAEAKAYWRSGLSKWHGEAQALSIIEQAISLIGQGLLSPIDADKHLGGFSDEFTSKMTEAE